MGPLAAPRRGQPRPQRVVVLVMAVVLGLAVLGLAMSFANSASAERVAENASLLHWTNSAHGSAALARSAVGQAVVFAIGEELGVVDAQDRASALSEAEESLAAFNRWADSAPPELLVQTPGLGPELKRFTDASSEVLQLLGSGDTSKAEEVRDGVVEEAYVSLAATVGANQRLVADRIANNEDRAALVSQMLRLLVTLLIPAVALIVYWRIARRQLRERRVEMNATVAAQHAMIAGVSHELRTPLTSIVGFSEVLLTDELGDQESVTELITVINTEAEQLARMVDDLLVAARVDMDEIALIPTQIDPRFEIDVVAAPFRRGGEEIHVECTSGTIEVDVEMFRHVLRNLISNAVKHGGPSCVVMGTWGDDEVRFTVMDDGTGVDEAIERDLFRPFVNHGERALLSGSVGLGLAVSRALARSMGGELTYARSDGWSRFSLTLSPDVVVTDEHENPTPVEAGDLFDEPARGASRAAAAAPSESG